MVQQVVVVVERQASVEEEIAVAAAQVVADWVHPYILVVEVMAEAAVAWTAD